MPLFDFLTPKAKNDNRKSSLNRQASFATMNDNSNDGQVISTMRSKMKNVLPLTKNFTYVSDENSVMLLEEVKLGKYNHLVRKVFLVNGSYKIGWVVDIDVETCMVCLHHFSWKRFRHHCRACGLLVCSDCSPFKAKLPNFEEEKESRVCVYCYGLKAKHGTFVAAGLQSPVAIGDEYSAKATGVTRRNQPSNQPAMRPNKKAILNQQGMDLLEKIRSDPEEMLERLEEDRYQEFKRKEMPLCELAYRKMREIVPAHILRTNYQTLRSEYSQLNIGQDLADHIWNTKILWLICMHPDDLQKVHIADLRSKYAFSGLDLLEMRAIYYVLPQLWDHTRESRRYSRYVNTQDENSACFQTSEINDQQVLDSLAPKRQWKQGFKERLESFIRKAECELLPENDVRNPVYKQLDFECSHIYDPNLPILPIFYRGASFVKNAVFETPPPPGSSLTAIQEVEVTPVVESYDLDGFNLLSPNARDQMGRCFQQNTFQSPETPGDADSDGKDGEDDHGNIFAGEDEDVENWNMNLESEEQGQVQEYEEEDQTDAVLTSRNGVVAPDTPYVLASEPKVVDNVLSPWTDAKIEAAMTRIELEEQKRRELELEMEAEIKRSQEQKQKEQEALTEKAAALYHSEVTKVVRRASTGILTPPPPVMTEESTALPDPHPAPANVEGSEVSDAANKAVKAPVLPLAPVLTPIVDQNINNILADSHPSESVNLFPKTATKQPSATQLDDFNLTPEPSGAKAVLNPTTGGKAKLKPRLGNKIAQATNLDNAGAQSSGPTLGNGTKKLVPKVTPIPA